jgi:endo-1,3-1,4-beta-glycanase ExoK
MKRIRVALFLALLWAFPLCAKDYAGAELYTSETYMYGRFEARMYMAAGSGLVSSMFLYYNDSYLGKGEPWVEIDMEVLGKSPSSFQSNIISGTLEKKIKSEIIYPLAVAANATYHTFTFEWTPTYVAWFVDSVEVRRTETDVNDTKGQVAALTKEQSFRFNLWSSEVADWVGAFDDAILPVNQYINWVKVYSYTPGAGNNGSDFSLLWTDDFDTYNATRWNAGNWTFDENRVDFTPDNINVQNGTLIISLTKAAQTGFSGTIPVDEGTSAIPAPHVNSTLASPRDVHTFDLMGRFLGTKRIEE